MQHIILAVTRDLLHSQQIRCPRTPSMDEIAACAGIKLHHLRSYYTSPDAARQASLNLRSHDALD
ncbi:hypothetical protein FPZ12_008060 [Amycolatopsis acidicola]|uniref:TetR family transcriptional regulator n=1 Tax=Amycolatopsis acidicola TaxID=2596893 RepID=A0A5N0VD42_9PSEU|nr:hypothetical protein [Amycolatopsis acidicola]KAA9163975.1 hypothetical protein FPZ12_008060 [Amycolatopsis acidicola]